MANTYAKYKVLGISDRSECDCCGKTNLRRSVVLESEAGEVVYYGTDCAAKSLRQRVNMFSDRTVPVSSAAALSMARRAKTEPTVLYQRAAA